MAAKVESMFYGAAEKRLEIHQRCFEFCYSCAASSGNKSVSAESVCKNHRRASAVRQGMKMLAA